MKIIITGLHGSEKNYIGDLLRQDGIKVGKLFSNLEENHYNSNNYINYSTLEVNKIFENKAYVYFSSLQLNDTVDDIYEGITTVEWDDNQVFIMQPNAVLGLQEKYKDVLYIWLDNQKFRRNYIHATEKRSYDFDDEEKIESKNFNEFINKIYGKNKGVIYFNNEVPERVKTIIKSIINHPEDLQEYIENFN